VFSRNIGFRSRDVQTTLDAWRHDHNHVRPHGSLGQQTPAQFRAGVDHQPGPDQFGELPA
jgi:transposase InsO family protein